MIYADLSPGTVLVDYGCACVLLDRRWSFGGETWTWIDIEKGRTFETHESFDSLMGRVNEGEWPMVFEPEGA